METPNPVPVSPATSVPPVLPEAPASATAPAMPVQPQAPTPPVRPAVSEVPKPQVPTMSPPPVKNAPPSSGSSAGTGSRNIYLLIAAAIAAIVLIAAITFGVLAYRDANISVNNMNITNVTDTAFTVAWVSDSEYIGRVYYREGNESWPKVFAQNGAEIAYDDRDIEIDQVGAYTQIEEGAQKRFTHHVTIRNLKPDAEYSFRVGGTLNGKEPPITSFKTKALIEDLETPDPAYGELGGLGNNDVIVYMFANNDEESQNMASTTPSESLTYSFDANYFGVEDFDATKVSLLIMTAEKTAGHTFDSDEYKPFKKVVVGEAEDGADSYLDSSLLGEVLAIDCDNVHCGTGASCDVGGTDDGFGFFCRCDNGSSGGFNSAGYSRQPTGSYDKSGDNTCSSGGSNSNPPSGGGENQASPPPATSSVDDCNTGTGFIGMNGNGFCRSLGQTCSDGIKGDTNSRILCNSSLVGPGGWDPQDYADTVRLNNPDSGPVVDTSEEASSIRQETGDFETDYVERWSVMIQGGLYVNCAERTFPRPGLANRGLATRSGDSNTYYLFVDESQCHNSMNAPAGRTDVDIPLEIETGYSGSLSRPTYVSTHVPGTDNNGRGHFMLTDCQIRDVPGTHSLHQTGTYERDDISYYFFSAEESCGSAQPPAGYSIGSGVILQPQGIVFSTSAQTVTLNRESAVLGASDDDGITVSENGSYAFFQDGERIATQDLVVGNNEITVRLFNDVDGNGLKGDGEEYFADHSQISIAKEASVEQFELSSGWNLINIPMIDTRTDNTVRTAGDLITEWNGQGAEIVHVARFRTGQFEIFSLREDTVEFSSDFDLIPGEGLFILNLGFNASVTFAGNLFEEPVPVQLSNGWNLIGVIAPGSDYDSEAVLEAIAADGIQASTISQFENGLYQSVVSQDDVVFGNNYNIVSTRGYFVKVESGGGETFTP